LKHQHAAAAAAPAANQQQKHPRWLRPPSNPRKLLLANTRESENTDYCEHDGSGDADGFRREFIGALIPMSAAGMFARIMPPVVPRSTG